jgi:mRNA-degrading endonuclease toxin of MazEF toxin-antitoxin module
MKPFSGSVRDQEIYEALIPFRIKYPYRIITQDNNVETKSELFPEEKEDEFIDEAEEIEIGTTYKLRPVIIISISQSNVSNDTYLGLPLTKKKDMISHKDQQFIIEVCRNTIKERHFLFKTKYSGTLRYDSFVKVDNIQLLTKNNIYKRRGRLANEDYSTIRVKLLKVLGLNPSP